MTAKYRFNTAWKRAYSSKQTIPFKKGLLINYYWLCYCSLINVNYMCTKHTKQNYVKLNSDKRLLLPKWTLRKVIITKSCISIQNPEEEKIEQQQRITLHRQRIIPIIWKTLKLYYFLYEINHVINRLLIVQMSCLSFRCFSIRLVYLVKNKLL